MLWIFGQDTKQNAKEMITVLGDYKAEYKGNTNDLQESTKLNCKGNSKDFKESTKQQMQRRC